MSAERILVVDDEPLLVQVCAQILVEAGYQAQEAWGGHEALARLEKEPFNLLLVDLTMPSIDGLTVLRRARERNPELAAIIMTSYGTIENAIEALRAGARGFLLKPFDPEDLVRAVDEALVAQWQEQENRVLRAQLPILETSQALMAEGDVESLAQRLLDIVVEQTQAERAAFLLLDDKAAELYVAASVGLPDRGAEGMQVPAAGGIVDQALRGEEPLALKGPSETKEDPLRQVLMVRADDVAVCVPLRTGQKAVGLLALWRPSGAAPFTQTDLDLLTILADQISIGLENARLYGALQQELTECRHLAEQAKVSSQ